MSKADNQKEFDNKEQETDVQPDKELTRRQSQFVEHMANPEIMSQIVAAIKAGCPEKSARVTASKWLTKANIREAILERKRRAFANAEVSPEEIVGHAAFNTRSSIDDVLDEEGAFDINKARATGAIDLVRKYRTRTKIDNQPGRKEITAEVEMYSAAEARRELTDYIGLTKQPMQPPKIIKEIDIACELYRRLVESLDWSEELAIEGVRSRFPNLDIERVIGKELL